MAKVPKTCFFCPKIKGGGPSEFQISRILTLKLCHTPISHQIYPQYVLKWPWECFLQKSFFKFWPQFFSFGESPGPRKIFLRKFFYANCYSSYISQYFPKNPKTCVKRHVWANNMGSRFLIFAFFLFFGGQKVQSCSTIGNDLEGCGLPFT